MFVEVAWLPLVSTVSLEHELVFIERKYDMPRLSFAVPGGNYACDSFVCTLLIVIFGQETGNYAHFCLITTYNSRYELFLRKASVLTRHNCTTGELQNLGDIFIPLFHLRRCIHSVIFTSRTCICVEFRTFPVGPYLGVRERLARASVVAR